MKNKKEIIKNQVVLLIPAYNPDEKMIDFINESSEYFNKILVVNDGCSSEYDAIFEKIKDKTTILKHEVNKGKGRALKTGFSYILDNEKDCLGVVTADADGQHTCEDVMGCCEDFLDDPDKGVFGCRDFYGDTFIPPRSKFGNRLTSKLMKFFCDIKLSDTQTGLRVFPTSSLKMLLEVEGDRYEYEMNVIFALKENNIEWNEHKISVIYIDDNKSSHFNPIKDSMKIYKVFLKFCISSLGSSILDIVLFIVLRIILKKYEINIWDKIDGIMVATVIARIFSGIFNYIINRMIFDGKKKSKAAISGTKYLVVWFVQMLLSAFIVSRLSLICTFIYPTIIKIVIDTLLFFISYKVQQKWVFK